LVTRVEERSYRATEDVVTVAATNDDAIADLVERRIITAYTLKDPLIISLGQLSSVGVGQDTKTYSNPCSSSQTSG
jgi:hypothetical protein